MLETSAIFQPCCYPLGKCIAFCRSTLFQAEVENAFLRAMVNTILSGCDVSVIIIADIQVPGLSYLLMCDEAMLMSLTTVYRGELLGVTRRLCVCSGWPVVTVVVVVRL